MPDDVATSQYPIRYSNAIVYIDDDLTCDVYSDHEV